MEKYFYELEKHFFALCGADPEELEAYTNGTRFTAGFYLGFIFAMFCFALILGALL